MIALLACSNAKRAMIEMIVGEGRSRSRSGGSAALRGAPSRSGMLGNRPGYVSLPLKRADIAPDHENPNV
jgi:hypothetical protein